MASDWKAGHMVKKYIKCFHDSRLWWDKNSIMQIMFRVGSTAVVQWFLVGRAQVRIPAGARRDLLLGQNTKGWKSWVAWRTVDTKQGCQEVPEVEQVEIQEFMKENTPKNEESQLKSIYSTLKIAKVLPFLTNVSHFSYGNPALFSSIAPSEPLIMM